MKFINVYTPSWHNITGVYCEQCFKDLMQELRLISIKDLPDKYICKVCGKRPWSWPTGGNMFIA
jgi:hypothetical protein